MNQAQSEPIKERLQKRREYLRKIIAAGMGATAFLLLSLGAGAVVFNNFTGPHWYHCLGMSFGPFIEWAFSSGKYWLGILPILAVCGATAVSAIAAVHCRKQYRTAVSVPFVPPIRKQDLVALTVDQVLLRGSFAPAAAPTELLRAAFSSETGADELLRPTERTT